MGSKTSLHIVGDREVAEMFGYTSKDISAFQKKLAPGYVCPPGQIDPRNARPVMIGRKRRWILEDVERLFRERV